jgi:hypothetical protein
LHKIIGQQKVEIDFKKSLVLKPITERRSMIDKGCNKLSVSSDGKIYLNIDALLVGVYHLKIVNSKGITPNGKII